MDHKIELMDCNVVVRAKHFNVSIVNQIWLHRNNIFSEEELKNSSFLQVLVNIQTDKFRFTLAPEKLQFSIAPATQNKKSLIEDKVGGLVTLLPHTPFMAAGLNFTYHITPADKDMYSLTRSLFCNEKSKLFEEFDSNDVRFGGYVSKDILDTRLRLDAKPVTIHKDDTKTEALQFSYNFNVNMKKDDTYKKIIDLIGKWEEVQEITKKITDKINIKD